jgi:hypothetical protein
LLVIGQKSVEVPLSSSLRCDARGRSCQTACARENLCFERAAIAFAIVADPPSRFISAEIGEGQ